MEYGKVSHGQKPRLLQAFPTPLNNKCKVTQRTRPRRLGLCVLAVGISLLLLAALQTEGFSSRSLRAFKMSPVRHSKRPSTLNYRIADGIKWLTDAPSCKVYPKSLVCAYQRKTSVANDLVTLTALLSSEPFSKYEKPKEDVVVAHLRLGDALCARFDPQCRGSATSVPDCWENSRDCWTDQHLRRQYAFSKLWYQKTISLLEPGRVIELFYNMDHWTRTLPDPRNGTFAVDKAYVKNVLSFFEQRGHTVRLRGMGDPDRDFVYMSHAKTFVRGGGGFSDLVSMVVVHRGGRVVGISECERCSDAE